MALHPSKFNGQFKLQPGARGEKFKASLPGYRNDEERINRSNIKLNHNEHDTPNIKYMFDDRLPVLFRYGYAYGYNQIVIPKGRIVAVDPFKDMVDFDMQKAHNTMTLANGGAPVKIRTAADKYKDYSGAAEKLVSTEAQGAALANADIEWMPIIGMEEAYTELAYRPFKTSGPMKQLEDAGYEIDPERGYVVDKNSKEMVDVIPGNHPIGMLIRNEYTRDEDAYNGMAPGAVNTDCLVELPWFAYKDKAEGNPWGSAYGGLFPGALVKADENGRVIVSPLSYETEVADMSISEYELERQQVIGQVYAVSTEMVPEGAAKWATWALSDRLNFEDFNPQEWPENNRRGEDAIGRSPYKSTGKYPGYPYEKNYGAHDLHMLGGTRTNYDQRLQHQYQYENLGIPGLTDGYNAVKRSYDAIEIGQLRFVKNITESMDLFFRFPEVKIEDMEIAIGTKADDKFVPLVEKGLISAYSGEEKATDVIEAKYVDGLQGLFVINIKDLTEANRFAEAVIPEGENSIELPVFVRFKKRGLAGVPTFMDWDGVVGSVKVLLQK
jgi:hypothetical protein|nr:MAG TPA: hypothetical protein [Caudoviricetes sp.]